MKKVTDILGNKIKNGSLVWWFDPDDETSGIYKVMDEPTEEMVYCENTYGTQNEVLPEELVVLDHPKSNKGPKRPVLFQFDVNAGYSVDELLKLDKRQCELLADADDDHVECFYLDQISVEELLNDQSLDVENCWFRIFIK